MPTPTRPSHAAADAPPARQEPAATPAARPAPSCGGAPDEETICPACGATMRLWANYHRCRTCGYKESCCF
jgi:hypothetical protein